MKVITSNSIFKNSIYLAVLQIFTMLAPLITFPYLARLLDVELFGILMMWFSFHAIGVLCVDFGFNLFGTYRVANLEDDKKGINTLLGNVVITKLLLSSIVVLISIPFLIYYEIELLTFISVVISFTIQSLNPIWLFQGLERMKEITISGAISKVLYVLGVIALYQEGSGLHIVFVVLATTGIVQLAISHIYISKFGYKLEVGSRSSIFKLLRDSAEYFYSRVAVSIYTSASTLVVGSVAGPVQASFYSSSEKIYNAAKGLTNTVSRALFPYLTKTKDHQLLIKVTIILALASVPFVLFGVTFSDTILEIAFGSEFSKGHQTLSVFLVAITVNLVCVNFGYPAFAALNRVDVANKSVVLGSVFQLLYLCCLYYFDTLTSLNVALGILFTEVIVVSYRVFFYVRLIKEDTDFLSQRD